MITSIELTNFKCFKSLALELRSLNVFAGMNGSGKSTVLQSLLSLRQSGASASLQRRRLQLNGTLTELGTAGEVYCAEPNSKSIELAFTSSRLEGRLELKAPQSEAQSKEYFLELDSEFQLENLEFDLFRDG